jgi:protein-S-isoprenylcysteine O-methyltransferase Ste14
VKDFLRKHRQLAFNVLLVALMLGRYAYKETYKNSLAGRFDAVEVAFAAHNVVFLTVILIRRQHQAVDGNVFHQFVALVAFFSGLGFREAATPHPAMQSAAQAIVLTAWLLSIATLVNLGRSFGILIAVRRVKTAGLYAVIRHPMYFSDILLRIGMILKWPSAANIVLFAVSTAAYVYRALLEEKFLSRTPEYREYMQRVQYRFVPGIF